MQLNNQAISGVLHQTKSATHYTLRRYFPSSALACLIEQFWFVDWDLPRGVHHVQKNLPDPNFHLVFSPTNCELIGPVSKVYDYKMTGKSGLIGVKFTLGALEGALPKPIEDFIDTSIPTPNLSLLDLQNLHQVLIKVQDDKVRVDTLEKALSPLCNQSNQQEVKLVNQLVADIKNQTNIYSVADLAKHSGLSIRTLQRKFKKYVGLSPKFLIRKYRLHQALALLDDATLGIQDLVLKLDYVDQAHLINDFKNILGTTPGRYTDGI
ncbi:helix-turn-helix transcriptional regulator [Pseudoalteromonas luteoviolacea]|uniref:helix-turn-helix transcriptional regulator n=1 Tax=Pseudoalteromonas luteoviolacea TaxID=43657 RepID=UPI0011538702|nr:helix-turn-helix transcriptional regulator [Pseudoalteromonas luteoviolacea]TQF68112.1 helix-turn-helix transcriptional regulator [Pseudoalteromonas luteoviolacea]